MTELVDTYGRVHRDLRVSLTDRCNLRCTYCMPHDFADWLPGPELLTTDELMTVIRIATELGITGVRLTGGEPLMRADVADVVRRINELPLRPDIALTTNGLRLDALARPLADAGLQRVNVSLDTLDPAKFATITRWGRLPQVLDGISAAKSAGLKVKINAVALKGFNEDELFPLLDWCEREGHDLTFIEVMPMGEDMTATRLDQYWPLKDLRARLADRLTLSDLAERTGGPARYVRVEETGQKIGFITPLTHNFCESCNRVRLTCTGELYMCLGQEDMADLRAPLRASPDDTVVEQAIRAAIARKPKGHDFDYSRQKVAGQITRHMSHTGG